MNQRPSIEIQTKRLINYLTTAAKRGRSASEIVAWGYAPDYEQIIAALEDRGIVYHSCHMITGVRYHIYEKKVRF